MLHIHHRNVHVHIHDELTPQEASERTKKGWLKRKRAQVVTKGRRAVTNYTAGPEYQALKQSLGTPGSEPRRNIGKAVLAFGKSLPAILRGHLREERENAVHAVGALKSLATGKRPSGEQLKGLRGLGMRVVLSSVSMAMTGEPTGAVMELVHQFGSAVVEHVVAEHVARAGAGLGRLAFGRDQGMELGPDDYALLNRFIEELAEAVANLDLSKARRA